LTESAKDFLYYYDRGVATLQGTDGDWLQWLPNCMNLLKADWVSHAILQQQPLPTAVEAKALLLKRFSPYDLKHRYEDMMRTLEKMPHESMLAWVDRFESCRRKRAFSHRPSYYPRVLGQHWTYMLESNRASRSARNPAMQ
jgi:hypothetical protein